MINVNTSKKIWKISVKLGLSLFLFSFMLITSISLVSFTQKGKVNYGSRCHSIINTKTISFLNQEEIISYDYDLKCNTLYLDLTLKDNTRIDTAKALLIRISSYYNSINYTTDTQITLKGNNYIILASLVKSDITINITNI